MKTLRTATLVLLMITASFANVNTADARNRRPGQNSSTTTVVRPGASNHNTKPSTGRPGNNGGNKNPIVRPGASSRPSYLTRPSRPNHLPSYSWVRPTRPSSVRPSGIRFSNNILNISFGMSLMNSLDRLYASNYSIDGYDSNVIYLRDVTEMNYRWTDATLYYSTTGHLSRSQFYESSIGYNTSRFYGVMNNIRHLYGSPATISNNGRTHTATWFGYDGEYITLEYRLLNASNGYRYYTILTIGR